MRVLIFHGYLLRGTGSNIYNASLAPALARLGHEVHLLCQDREVRPPGVHVHNPEIGRVLPVFVPDPYPGFEAKPFQDLTEAELSHYLEANVAAVREVAAAAGGIDLALANHLVMGPAILARAGVAPFAAKIHGSDLAYTVGPHPRFVPYAEEGMRAARCALVGSRHTAESLWATLPNLGELPARTRLGPPGLDVEVFRPAPRSGDPLVAFVGKLILAKGPDLLLAAWPLVRQAHPRARLALGGYGAYEEGLRELLAALDDGDLARARGLAGRGWEAEGGERRPLPILSAFLAAPPPGYAEAARGMAAAVELRGRLEHERVAELLRGCDALAMPSTFPEAFGMVAAEAAACGALPVCAEHSGLGEVARRLAEPLPPQLGRLTAFPLGEGAVTALAERIVAWLSLPAEERRQASAVLAETARRAWSWEAVATTVLAAAAGEIADLPLAKA